MEEALSQWGEKLGQEHGTIYTGTANQLSTPMTEEDRQAILRYLGFDLADPAIRQRAWRRLRVFREIIAECEADDNPKTADWLREICYRAVTEQDAVCIAILAGPNRVDKRGKPR